MKVVFEKLNPSVRLSLEDFGVFNDARLNDMTDAELMKVPMIGKGTVQRIRELQGRVTPTKPKHSRADRLWLAGMAMREMIARGHGSAEDAVLAADQLLAALDV